MKNIKISKNSFIKAGVFRIFTYLILVFTIIIYILILVLVYLKYIGELDIIYTQEATHLLITIVLSIFTLGWFFLYTIYIALIRPIYDTFNIINEMILVLLNQDFIDKEQVRYLNDFVNKSLIQLNQSSITKKMNISLITESYIKKLGNLIKQNEVLVNSKEELSNLVYQLEKQHTLLGLEKAKTSAIIDSLPNGLLVTSRDGNIFLVNQELERILGIESVNLLGKFAHSILPDMKLTKTFDIATKYNHETTSFDYISADNKKKITIENTSSPIIINGDILGVVYILKDTTQEQATERAQKEFVSLASHQLRTPITSIKWNSEIILSTKNLNKEVLIAANDICKESIRMEKLVNSLLNLSRIDLGKIKLSTQEIYLDKYIETLLSTLKLELDSKNLDFETNILFKGPIINDPVYLDIIIGNLVYNAIKYSNNNTSIKINISKKLDLFAVEVIDKGIGIPKSQQSQIFSRLFRAENAKKYQPDGNGLGLYIVKKLVDLMNGNIWFESKENQGTKFFIELPIAIKK